MNELLGASSAGRATPVAGTPRRWTFGPAVLDESAMTLSVDGSVVGVERKSLEVLRHLLRHAGKLVTKDDLLAGVWPGRIVSESVLTKSIHKLREALGAQGQEIVTTVHGYGYRLDGPVEFEDLADTGTTATPRTDAGTSAVPPPSAPGPTYRRRWAMPVGVSVAFLLLGAGFLALRTQPVATLDKSVAVLPFTNLSDETGSAWFVDGMQDEILTTLSKISALKVISRTSTEKYRDVARNLPQIAEELGVATILEGSVQRAGNRARIHVQLIDAKTDAHLWAERYDRELTDLFAVQSDVARQVASALRANLLPAESQAVQSAPTENPKAYDRYLQALAVEREISGSNLPANYEEAIALYEQALAEDPEFALAWAAKGRLSAKAYWWLGDSADARLSAAKQAIDRALELAPELGEAYMARGIYYYYGHRDYARALGNFERARELLPNSSEAWAFLGYIKRRQGQWDEALAAIQKSAVLNPLSAETWGELAGTYDMLRRHKEEKAAVKRYYAAATHLPSTTLRVDKAWQTWEETGDLSALREAYANLTPGSKEYLENNQGLYAFYWFARDFAAAAKVALEYPHEWAPFWTSGATALPVAIPAARALLFAGDTERARGAYSSALRMIQERLKDSPDDAALHVGLAHCYAGLGQKAEAIAAGERAIALMPVHVDAIIGAIFEEELAMIYAQVGEHDKAIELLAQSWQRPGGVSEETLRYEPRLDPLRGDPRFKALLKEP